MYTALTKGFGLTTTNTILAYRDDKSYKGLREMQGFSSETKCLLKWLLLSQSVSSSSLRRSIIALWCTRCSRQTIKEQVLAIISMRSLHLPDKNIFYQAFNFYVAKNISFADAYNAAYMLAEGISNIYTWDKGFDKIEGIARLEPEEK